MARIKWIERSFSFNFPVELYPEIIERLRGWVFPKPLGGGMVLVTYPFVFKTTG